MEFQGNSNELWKADRGCLWQIGRLGKIFKRKVANTCENFKYEQHGSTRKIFNITNQDKKVPGRPKWRKRKVDSETSLAIKGIVLKKKKKCYIQKQRVI